MNVFKVKLFRPDEYKAATIATLKKVCNGCGSKGLGGFFVPNTLYGLNIEEACDIHDWMYLHGTTIEDKHKADRVFRNNMVRIIEAKSGRFLKPLRKIRANTYYQVVKHFGGPAFWDKNLTL